MKGFADNIETRTEENSDFRRVLYTGKHMQLVLMSLKPGEDIGEEVHQDADQFFRVEEGQGEVWIDGAKTNIKSEFAIIVPAGARHNVINTGNTPCECIRSMRSRITGTEPCMPRRLMPSGPRSTSTGKLRKIINWRAHL